MWAWAVCWNPCRRPPSSSRTTVSSAPGPSCRRGAHLPRIGAGAGVVITGSTHIIDVTEAEPKQYKGYVPAGSVVIPGRLPQAFPGRGVRRSLCADYRTPQGVHRQENFRSPRRSGISEFRYSTFRMHRTRYHFLEETTSTNDEARNPRYGHGDAICAERQTAGRGSGAIPGAARRDAT